MRLLKKLLGIHIHYWGVPHPRESDKRPIQTCYECSAEREIQVDLSGIFNNKETNIQLQA